MVDRSRHVQPSRHRLVERRPITTCNSSTARCSSPRRLSSVFGSPLLDWLGLPTSFISGGAPSTAWRSAYHEAWTPAQVQAYFALLVPHMKTPFTKQSIRGQGAPDCFQLGTSAPHRATS
jgi:hypothetical protein